MSQEERQERQQAGMMAWGEWVDTNRSSIVDIGAPLGRTKRISRQGITDTSNDLTAYVIVKAVSHEMAARLFKNHPHFTLFPGDSVKVVEFLPMPGL